MIALAKMSANGQITLPIEVRKILGVSAGDKVLFYKNDRGEIVMANAASDALVIAQKAFAGAAKEMGIANEQEVDEMIFSMRKETTCK